MIGQEFKSSFAWRQSLHCVNTPHHAPKQGFPRLVSVLVLCFQTPTHQKLGLKLLRKGVFFCHSSFMHEQTSPSSMNNFGSGRHSSLTSDMDWKQREDKRCVHYRLWAKGSAEEKISLSWEITLWQETRRCYSLAGSWDASRTKQVEGERRRRGRERAATASTFLLHPGGIRGRSWAIAVNLRTAGAKVALAQEEGLRVSPMPHLCLHEAGFHGLWTSLNCGFQKQKQQKHSAFINKLCWKTRFLAEWDKAIGEGQPLW